MLNSGQVSYQFSKTDYSDFLVLKDNTFYSFERYEEYKEKAKRKRFKKNNPGLIIIEKFLEEKEDGATTEEIQSILLDNNIKIKYLSQFLQRGENFFNWGRSIYIHRNCIKVSNKFLSIMSNYIRFNCDERKQYIAIQKLFNIFENECAKERIFNYFALYSVLSLLLQSDFQFCGYPLITTLDNSSPETLSEIIEKYFNSFENGIEYTILKEYFTNEIGINTRSFRFQIRNNPKIVKKGDLVFHTSKILHELSYKKRVSKKYFNKQNKMIFDFDYTTLCSQNEIEISNETKYILEQLRAKKGSVSTIRISSLSRVKKIDFNTVIFYLNSKFRKIFKRDFLLFENEIWEVNPFFNHPGNWVHKDKTTEKEMNDIELEKDSEEEYPKWLLDQADKLEDVFKHTATSYKFYWFKALLTLVERGKKESSFKQMAALMCAHAWKDVLIKNCIYTTIDQIPNVVRRIYLDSQLQSTENENTIIDYLYDNLEKYDDLFIKLLNYVPFRFLSFFVTNGKKISDEKKHKRVLEFSKKKQTMYLIEKNSVTINFYWYSYLKIRLKDIIIFTDNELIKFFKKNVEI